MDAPAQPQPDAVADPPAVADAPEAADASDLGGGSFGEFLRNRRGRVAPEAAGFPAGGRRRTPGLRREELATIAGISVDYLTRLEQGRETNPSLEVLDALGRALDLGSDEWLHMKHLARRANNPEMCPSELPDVPLSAATLAILGQLDPTPAFVLEQTGDVTAWNRAYGGLMAATGLFDLEPPNLLRYSFLVPAARDLFENWEGVAIEQLGNLRAATAHWPNDPQFRELIGELAMESSTFANMWACQEVSEKRRGRKRFNHPVAGELTMDFEGLGIPDGRERLLVTYIAADEVTGRAFEGLARSGEPRFPPDAEAGPGSSASASYLHLIP